MTFEQFQATRRHTDDLGAVLSDARWEDEPSPASGFVYLDSLYIEDVQSHWPDTSKARGKYHLIIGRYEWISDDLALLEHELYEFALGEGYSIP
jgi:hypothetical protein